MNITPEHNQEQSRQQHLQMLCETNQIPLAKQLAALSDAEYFGTQKQFDTHYLIDREFDEFDWSKCL